MKNAVKVIGRWFAKYHPLILHAIMMLWFKGFLLIIFGNTLGEEPFITVYLIVSLVYLFYFLICFILTDHMDWLYYGVFFLMILALYTFTKNYLMELYGTIDDNRTSLAILVLVLSFPAWPVLTLYFYLGAWNPVLICALYLLIFAAACLIRYFIRKKRNKTIAEMRE